jgi:glycerophosphoryl diester phosphodiesterase
VEIVIKKGLLIGLIVLMAIASFQHFYGGIPSDVPLKTTFEILAHRGVHQNYEKDVYDKETGCEAIHIYKPAHHYIDNTLESIGAAFSFGATIVEIDIRQTADNQLVIFHDGTLECRTNGNGQVRDYTVQYLKSLDIGYGYTYDHGQTFPLRSQGIGKMPTLTEIIQAFPGKKFLLDHKDGSIESAKILVNTVSTMIPDQQRLLYYWGPDESYAYIHQEVPFVTRLLATKSQETNWMMPYLLTGGLAAISAESKGVVMGMPPSYVPIVWGWPYRFLREVSDVGAKFYLMIDTEEEARAFSKIPVDGVITDYIEVVGKYFKGAP